MTRETGSITENSSVKKETAQNHGNVCYNKTLSVISLFHRAFQFTIYNGPNNALVCNKTLIQMLQNETLRITPTCFDHQMIIIREFLILVKITG
jgi:hypothetical protein